MRLQRKTTRWCLYPKFLCNPASLSCKCLLPLPRRHVLDHGVRKRDVEACIRKWKIGCVCIDRRKAAISAGVWIGEPEVHHRDGKFNIGSQLRKPRIRSPANVQQPSPLRRLKYRIEPFHPTAAEDYKYLLMNGEQLHLFSVLSCERASRFVPAPVAHIWNSISSSSIAVVVLEVVSKLSLI
jgi:hypothetical protein